MAKLTGPEYDGLDVMEKIDLLHRKSKEGRPPSESELEYCKKIQEHEKKRIISRQMLRRARKKLKRATPRSEASVLAEEEIERANETS